MAGDLCEKAIFTLAEECKALMIVDEAHSAGVLGKHLLGIFEYHDITITPRHIKMGTLGKAYGSYGAYILASEQLISFLVNRAKPIIYSTAPSLFDTALAYVNLKHIQKQHKAYHKRIRKQQKLVKKILGIHCPSLILPIEVSDNQKTQTLQAKLIEKGYLVGAIRQPTVKKPIMRVILNVRVSEERLREVLVFLGDKG